MKKLCLILSVFILSNVAFALPNKYGLSITPTDNISYYYPVGDHSSDQLIEHSAYSLNYLDSYEQSNWTFYILNFKKLDSAINRKNNFRPDPLVKTETATNEDYVNSGYDKGHLVPAADMAYTQSTMDESFFISNMSPQVGEGFNRGSWRFLELYIRNIGEQYNFVYIYTGPVLSKDPSQYKTIGKKTKICVPEQYYKVVLINLGNKIYAAGFLYNNEAADVSPSNCIVTVSTIESLTGLSFFNSIPSDLQTNLNNTIELDFWKSIKGF